MKILAVCGSLRKNSYHMGMLQALQKKVPVDINYEIAPSLDFLPHFDPDLDEARAYPEPVSKWQGMLQAADVVVFSVPEYAHAMPGTFKNALDWVVGSGELMYKSVAIINGSTNSEGAAFVHASMIHTLGLMTANVITDACLNISRLRKRITADGIILDPDLEIQLNNVVNKTIAASKEQTKADFLGRV